MKQKRCQILGLGLKIWFWLISLAVILFFPIIPSYAQDTGVASTLGNFVAELIGWIAAQAIKVLGLLFSLLSQAIVWLGKYDRIIDADPVTFGWIIARDLANMFFVVVLLFIALGTMFNHETYAWKKTLPRFIASIVLVNFSKTIAGIFIDFSNVIMLTFFNAISQAGEGNFADLFRLDQFFTLNKNTWEVTSNAMTLGGGMVIAALMLFIAVLVMAVACAILVFRIIYLWFLVILSPLAVLCGIWPSGKAQKYYSKWWDDFTNYLIVGPVLGFFIWLALMSASFTKAIVAKVPGSGVQGLTNIQTTDVFISFIVGIGMLLLGLMQTVELGVAGSGLASGVLGWLKNIATGALSIVGKAGVVPSGLAKLGLGYAGRKYNEIFPTLANPVALYRGFMERREALHERAKKLAAAGGRQVIEKFFTGVTIPYQTAEQISQEKHFAEEFEDLSKEEKARIAYEAQRTGGLEGQILRRGILRNAASGGHLDDIMGSDRFRERYLNRDAAGNPIQGTGFYNYAKLHQFFQDYLGAGRPGGPDQEDMRLMYDLEETGKKVHHQEYGGHARYDTVNERFFIPDTEAARRQALSELAKTTVRMQVQEAPHVFGDLVVDPDGVCRMGNLQEEFARQILVGRELSEIQRYIQERTTSYMLGGTGYGVDRDEATGALRLQYAARDLGRIQQVWDINREAIKAMWRTAGGGRTPVRFITRDTNQRYLQIGRQLQEIVRSNAQLDAEIGAILRDRASATAIGDTAAFRLFAERSFGNMEEFTRYVRQLRALRAGLPRDAYEEDRGQRGAATQDANSYFDISAERES